ncbi:MAG: acylphosphatase [Gemmataceae bacterium]
MSSVAVHVVYAGRVQGVGFRATVADLARKYPVAGWVRNLPDGRVELWAEGPAAVVDGLLAAVRDTYSRHIRAEARDDPPATGAYRSFDIVR